MPPIRRPLLSTVAAALMVVLLAGGGFAVGVTAARSGVLPPEVGPAPAAGNAGLPPAFAVFREAWRIVHEHYVDQSAIDPTKLTYGAIQGMLTSLGDVGHTRFLSPQDLRQEQAALSGHLEGIGAEVTVRNGRPTVVAPIEGSPAQRAGLRAGDVFVRVDGKEVAGLSLEQVVDLVRGPPGTAVTLTVLHPGETTLTDLRIVRARIDVPSVTWAMVPGTQTADVLVSQFAEHASDELKQAITAARQAGATGLVLDLRNDPGGLRDEAIAVASQFLKDGVVLIEQDAQGHQTQYRVQPGGIAIDIPLVVLVNQGTASSAEIVAGALQDHRRAPLVGATTFGTGTVLSEFRLSDGSALLLGTAEWLTPNGRVIWHHGIVPDLQVSLAPSATPLTPTEVRNLSPAELRASADQQLLRAIAALTGPPIPTSQSPATPTKEASRR